MPTFKKRTYSGLRPFLKDLRSLWSRRAYFKFPLGVKGIEPPFFERLFLAETEVNGCRYCSFAHSRAALKAGVPAEEVRELLSREWIHVPEGDRQAVAYAQHWADKSGSPDPEAAAAIEQAYGSDTAARINYALRLARLCNYFGNFIDLCIFKLSFGRFGA